MQKSSYEKWLEGGGELEEYQDLTGVSTELLVGQGPSKDPVDSKMGELGDNVPGKTEFA